MVHSNVAAELANIDRQFPMMPNPKVINLSLHHIDKEIIIIIIIINALVYNFKFVLCSLETSAWKAKTKQSAMVTALSLAHWWTRI